MITREITVFRSSTIRTIDDALNDAIKQSEFYHNPLIEFSGVKVWNSAVAYKFTVTYETSSDWQRDE